MDGLAEALDLPESMVFGSGYRTGRQAKIYL